MKEFCSSFVPESPLNSETAVFGPESLSLIDSIYEDAWGSIAANFETHPELISEARQELAKAIFVVACDHTQDLHALKVAALKVFSSTYPVTPGVPGQPS